MSNSKDQNQKIKQSKFLQKDFLDSENNFKTLLQYYLLENNIDISEGSADKINLLYKSIKSEQNQFDHKLFQELITKFK